jgi:hypothetical protein
MQDGETLMVFGMGQDAFAVFVGAVDDHGRVTTEWALTPEEIGRLLSGGRVCLRLYGTDVHLGKPLTPVVLEVLAATPATRVEVHES